MQSLSRSQEDFFHAGRTQQNYGPQLRYSIPHWSCSRTGDTLPEIRPDRIESKWVHEFIRHSLNYYDNEDGQESAVQASVELLDCSIPW